MTTPIRFTLFAFSIIALIAVFASPAWAPSPVCPNCSFKKTTWAITPSEMVRVCLVGLVTRPPRAAIDWEIGFFDANGETLLSKQARVPQQGFRCVDTTAEELRLAGVEPEASGRLQWGLYITSRWEAVPLRPDEKPVKLTSDRNTHHSVETIDVLSQTTKHRFHVSDGVHEVGHWLGP